MPATQTLGAPDDPEEEEDEDEDEDVEEVEEDEELDDEQYVVRAREHADAEFPHLPSSQIAAE